MRRRTVLRVSGAGGLSALSGCVETARCWIDGNFDRLEVKPMPTYVREYPESVVIRFADLSSPERNVVETAIATGGVITKCHVFDGAPNAVMQLADTVRTRWEDGDVASASAFEHTYIGRDGRYFGLEIGLLDTVVVDSIPLACAGGDCREVTPTPPG